MKNDTRSRVLKFIRTVEGKSGITQMNISEGSEVSRQTTMKYIKEFINSGVIIYDANNKVYMKTKKPDSIVKKVKDIKRSIFPPNPNRIKVPHILMDLDGFRYIMDGMDSVLIEANTIGYSLKYYTKKFQEDYTTLAKIKVSIDVPMLSIDKIDRMITLIDYDNQVMVQVMDSTDVHANYKLIDILYNEAIKHRCTALVCLMLSDYRPNPYNVRYFRVVADDAVVSDKEND